MNNPAAVTSALFNVDRIREDFPILKRIVNRHPLVYLDNAATAQRPAPVLQAMEHYNTFTNANIHRAIHTLGYESTKAYEDAHRRVARFIGATTWREIIFTRNATESANLVAWSWGIQNLMPGDEVIISIMEHHSNFVPWLMLRERYGIIVRFIPINENGTLNIKAIKGLITSRTKLISVTHASNVLGTINPVDEISEIAHNAGALFMIDAAQSIPHFPVNVKDINCDFLIASGHKMCGPTGIGFLYVKKNILESMPPFLTGGDMIATVTTEGATWNELPWRFEAGTPAIAEGIGLGACIDYLEGIGMKNIEAYESGLYSDVLKKLKSLNGIKLYGHQSGKNLPVFSFNIDGLHPHDAANILDGFGIAVRSGHHCAQPLMEALGMDNTLRASFSFYNTVEEADILVSAIKEIQSKFHL